MQDLRAGDQWALDGVWVVERRRIEDFVLSQLRETSRGSEGSVPDQLILKGIAGMFTSEAMSEECVAADGERLRREAGSARIRGAVEVTVVVLMLSELGAFAYRWAIGDAYSAICLLGILAVGGAWSFGWGVRAVASTADSGGWRQGGGMLAWIAVVIGVAAMTSVFSGLVAASTERMRSVVAWMLPLALAISVAEAVRGGLARRYRRYRRLMFEAQVAFANAEFKKYQREARVVRGMKAVINEDVPSFEMEPKP
jgi:hypothetical protein